MPRCAAINGPTDTSCRKCGLVITEGAAAAVRKLMANDPALLLQVVQVLQRGMDEAKKTPG
ncbi:MAG TPA: hypothetical protein ENN52_02515 [Methanofollis liminatans]|uniref:Uncharacterized protein n=1 Tax=Methanofollis liminatans TaxID=2201 RepID=A0A831PME4_9EURY|nr:hypothetical protein [Methanofollis liminatans]